MSELLLIAEAGLAKLGEVEVVGDEPRAFDILRADDLVFACRFDKCPKGTVRQRFCVVGDFGRGFRTDLGNVQIECFPNALLPW